MVRRMTAPGSSSVCSDPQIGFSRAREGSPRKAALLVQSWFQDSTGLDEKIWPLLEQDLRDTTRD